MIETYKYTVIITFANGYERGFLVETDTYCHGTAIQKALAHLDNDLWANIQNIKCAMILLDTDRITMEQPVVG